MPILIALWVLDKAAIRFCISAGESIQPTHLPITLNVFLAWDRTSWLPGKSATLTLANFVNLGWNGGFSPSNLQWEPTLRWTTLIIIWNGFSFTYIISSFPASKLSKLLNVYIFHFVWEQHLDINDVKCILTFGNMPVHECPCWLLL